MPASPEPAVPRRALMLHGAGGGGWEWNRWKSVFEAADWVVDAPDLEPADDGLAATSLDDYRRQLRERLRAQPPDALIGASLGALLCLAEADSVPDTPLVLVNPLPPSPEATDLPARPAYPAVVAWASAGRFEGTAGSMEDASASARLFAYRRWRDESGRVLNEARTGLVLDPPACPSLVVASEQDRDVPVALSAALALRLGASLLRLPGDHLSPLLGDRAHEAAAQAVAWLNTAARFRRN